MPAENRLACLARFSLIARFKMGWHSIVALKRARWIQSGPAHFKAVGPF